MVNFMFKILCIIWFVVFSVYVLSPTIFFTIVGVKNNYLKANDCSLINNPHALRKKVSVTICKLQNMEG